MKDSSTQTGGKEEKTKEEVLDEWRNMEKKPVTMRNSLEEFQLCDISALIDYEKYFESEKLLDKRAVIKRVIFELNERLTKNEILDKRTEKSFINSGLVTLLCLLTSHPDDSEDRLIEIAKLVDYLVYDPELNFKSFLLKGLMNTSINLVKILFRNFYSFLLDHLKNFKHKNEFLKILIESILANEDEDIHTLIDLAGNLFTDIAKMKKDNPENENLLDIDFTKIFWDFFNKFQNLESKEKNFESPVDFNLMYSLSFLVKLLETEPSLLDSIDDAKKNEMVSDLLQNCLFNISNGVMDFNGLKCKSLLSREAALNLLKILCKNNPRAIILVFFKGLSLLTNHIPNISSASKGYYTGSEYNKKSELGYLGIKNLGCICYMIAMLQNFFCIGTFRRGILMANDYKTNNPQEIKGRVVDDNMFHQFQLMLASLETSHRKAFDPTDFCLSFKGYDGQPVNTAIQEDSQEFLNRFFDKLENSLKETPFKKILESVFGGYKINIIECKGCGFIRTNRELYYTLSVNVKNLNNLDEGLDNFIKPETIPDFLCDNCKEKCDISKYCKLGELPNVLIIHLNKIIFDLDFMSNIKVSTKYEFEKKINLKNYMYEEKSQTNEQQNKNNDSQKDEIKETKNDQDGDGDKGDGQEPVSEDFEYKLVGVVIHKGTAEWGHYVSIIDINRGKGEEKWLMFDDSNVSEFNMNNFKEECFGGNQKEDYGPSIYDFGDAFGGASKSAYILVYDKIKKSDLQFEFNEQNIEEKNWIVSNLVEKDKFQFADNKLVTNFYNLGEIIHPNIQSIIDLDNNKYILEQQLFNSSFLKFFSDLMLNSDLPLVLIPYLDSYYNLERDNYDNTELPTDNEGNIPSLPEISPTHKTMINIMAKSVPPFFFKVFCYSNEEFKLPIMQKILERVYIFNPAAARDFFFDYMSPNFNFILHHLVTINEKVVRISVAELFSSAILIMMKVMQFKICDNHQMSEHEIVLKNFIDQCMNFIPQITNANYKKMGEYFYFLNKCLQKNFALQDYLIEHEHHHTLYQYYMEKVESKSYVSDIHEKSLFNVLGALAILFRRIKAKYVKDGNRRGYYRNLLGNYLSGEFYKKMLQEDYMFCGYEYIKQLVYLGCENNEIISFRLIYICLYGIIMNTTNDIIPYMESLKVLSTIYDSLHIWRITQIFGQFQLEETKSKSSTNIIYKFGLAKEKNLQKGVYSFINPILKQKGILELINQKKDNFKEWVIVVCSFLIDILQCADQAIAHVFRQPCASAFSGNVISWMWVYAKEMDEESELNGLNLVSENIQYCYIKKFKEKVNDFIVYIRYKFGLRDLPQVCLFEDDHEIDMGKYQANGYIIQLDENVDSKEILSPCLKFLREKIDNHLDILEVLKIQYESSSTIKITSKNEFKNEESSDEENQEESERVCANIDKVIFSGSNYNYLFGKSLKKELVQEILLERRLESYINEDYVEKKQNLDLKISVNVQEVLSRLSLPIGEKGNLSVPSCALYMKSYLKTNSTIDDKIFSNFIREHIEEEPPNEDDKELEQYFNEIHEDNKPTIPIAPSLNPPIPCATNLHSPTTNMSIETLINNEENIIPISKTKIIRISVLNRTNENYFIKIEFNKLEDLIFSDQVISKGYFENKETEVMWCDNDAYSEDETNDEENYHKSVAENFKSRNTRLFRSNLKSGSVDKKLKRNYEVSDFVQGVWSKKKDTPLCYLQKNNEMDAFGFIVMRISWIAIEKSSISSLENALKKTWNWKLVKIELP